MVWYSTVFFFQHDIAKCHKYCNSTLILLWKPFLCTFSRNKFKDCFIFIRNICILFYILLLLDALWRFLFPYSCKNGRLSLKMNKVFIYVFSLVTSANYLQMELLNIRNINVYNCDKYKLTYEAMHWEFNIFPYIKYWDCFHIITLLLLHLRRH